MKYIHGDLLELAFNNYFDVIAHGCNCFCVMGSGLAKQVRKKIPEAYEVDTTTNKGDIDKLGTYSECLVIYFNYKLTVLNCYTQFKYGRGLHTNYDAIRSCMQQIKSNFSGKRIGLPRIGAGLGGGDWQIIEQIIAKELHDENVTIVVFN